MSKIKQFLNKYIVRIDKDIQPKNEWRNIAFLLAIGLIIFSILLLWFTGYCVLCGNEKKAAFIDAAWSKSPDCKISFRESRFDEATVGPYNLLYCKDDIACVVWSVVLILIAISILIWLKKTKKSK